MAFLLKNDSGTKPPDRCGGEVFRAAAFLIIRPVWRGGNSLKKEAKKMHLF